MMTANSISSGAVLPCHVAHTRLSEAMTHHKTSPAAEADTVDIFADTVWDGLGWGWKFYTLI